jgi:hypothetical protein
LSKASAVKEASSDATPRDFMSLLPSRAPQD